jgi:hypothetical protein
MNRKGKATDWQPIGIVKREDDDVNDVVVNDSLGTVDPADSSGVDEEMETGDAKVGNTETRED